MGCARLQITNEYLLDRLALPTDTRIIQAEMSDDSRDVVLYLVHPDLKPVALAEGELPPRIVPSFRRQSDVLMVDWGQS